MYESNKHQMEKILNNISKKITSNDTFQTFSDKYEKSESTENNLIDIIMNEIKNSELKDITEYGRAVHAEMAALLSASRLGIRLRGASLFSTTYPCHNCAKHIVAAGISRVVYIEPYPKSLADELHDDSITKNKNEKNRLFFEPFIGVGPRRFFDLFSLTLSSGREITRHHKGFKIDFEAKKAQAEPREKLRIKSIKFVESRQEIFENTK